MSNILEIENLSKQYRLGTVGTGTLSHDLNRWWYRMRGKEDPYLKIGEANDRSVKGSSEYVWALRDINLTVKEGEVLGIIGKNGAGKSTLLKILSKVTGPTTGSIKAYGRIASLLEVGTGFHPELTGRENIFLNGAILGMTKQEIRSKFDEIVDFSGVERYIDTPVKRYSSGMYVRLAFAVAAHLEPEILIVDEVLAVGDAEFQKKAIGKMKDVSQGQGRTVLFVSHNMGAVKNICNTTMLLHNGMVKNIGSTISIINEYFNYNNFISEGELYWKHPELPGDDSLQLYSIRTYNDKNEVKSTYLVDERIHIEFHFVINERLAGLRFNIVVKNRDQEIAFITSSHFLTKNILKLGKHRLICTIPANLLNTIEYTISVNAGIPGVRIIFIKENCLKLQINGIAAIGSYYNIEIPGVIAPNLNWRMD